MRAAKVNDWQRACNGRRLQPGDDIYIDKVARYLNSKDTFSPYITPCLSVYKPIGWIL